MKEPPWSLQVNQIYVEDVPNHDGKTGAREGGIDDHVEAVLGLGGTVHVVLGLGARGRKLSSRDATVCQLCFV